MWALLSNINPDERYIYFLLLADLQLSSLWFYWTYQPQMLQSKKTEVKESRENRIDACGSLA